MKKVLLLISILSSVASANNIILEKSIIKLTVGFEEKLQNTPKNIQVITSKEI